MWGKLAREVRSRCRVGFNRYCSSGVVSRAQSDFCRGIYHQKLVAQAKNASIFPDLRVQSSHEMSEPSPTGQKPGSYADSFRGRSAHSEFADPCEIARQVCTCVCAASGTGPLAALSIDRSLPLKESMKCLDRNSYNKSKCVDVSSIVVPSNRGFAADTGLCANLAVLPSCRQTLRCTSSLRTTTDDFTSTHMQYRDCKKTWVS